MVGAGVRLSTVIQAASTSGEECTSIILWRLADPPVEDPFEPEALVGY